MRIIYLGVLVLLSFLKSYAQNQSELWFPPVKSNPVEVLYSGNSVILKTAKDELKRAWDGPSGAKISFIITKQKALKADGFILNQNSITANSDKGILYGAFELLRRQQTGKSVTGITENPSYQLRLLNHWDNPDGSVERGYAGNSIFWRKNDLKVTDQDVQRWKTYARANASIGINGSVLNNVNASALLLTPDYLERVKAIASVLRPYGIRVYLSVNFSSPEILGKLKTADPLNEEVRMWWKNKIAEIYRYVPDFGGFVVKASSEGQPGPQDFGRTHADGANMMASFLKPHGGVVMWRAFVYSPNDKDRAKQAYNEFKPLDGAFQDNVIIQVKNGPIDFQPREPFSPLFGAMKQTALMPEFQITQEYLGQSVHLVYLSPMWEECLKSDTYQKGKGSTVAKITDGGLFRQAITAMAGVSNIGLDSNWTGHLFGQANWYAFGRLAWNNQLTSTQIADEWLKLSFKPQPEKNKDWHTLFLTPMTKLLMDSREAAVNYMSPLGLHHIMSANDHYGPGPWWAPKDWRADWTPPYYHQASISGIGFDRTRSGSGAVNQYNEPLASAFNNAKSCPENLLLWFHHLPWDYQMKSGKSLWYELCLHYELGVQQVLGFQKAWEAAKVFVDEKRFSEVQHKLSQQEANALLWKDACLLYFQQFSKRPFPEQVTPPVHTLEDMIRQDAQKQMGKK
ncbi:alpha-glucuronidase [Pedobacter sp. MW01-1-1]|uniref:alpha-glucuronidase n=1 Tax=Pedobacter sp. MW01-1-1 TaxID=3383027 RepID=UPI003FF10B89